jgi:hypothetical protein
VSPAVRSLTAPDPDLDVSLSREEVKATLEEATYTPPASAPPPPELGASSDWQSATQEQADRDREYKERLAVTVYSAAGSYHRSSCPDLYVQEYDQRSQRFVPKYIGHQITLGDAKTSGLSRHSACNPPSYDYRYSK